jgi:glutamyl-tRNA synthetase
MRVRFAPSPTGNLHIGGARTAIFNYLLARKHGGEFLLRIEDTDKKRSRQEYETEIIDSMAWLGLQADEEPIHQSTRLDAHREAVEKLLENGKAFRCFLSVEDARELKEKAMAEGDDKAFRSPYRDLDSGESAAKAESGEPYAVRLKIPEGETTFTDGVHGQIRTPNYSVDDFIIQRMDGSPTYMMAVVVDDHDMRVDTVLRGDDHITNTPKQVMIYEALGWEIPSFSHVPLILGPDKKRLSKRHGATAISEYRKQGYLPEAVVSYLAMLGWNPKDDRENLTLDQLIDVFDVSGINKKSAVFDEQKLQWVNGEFLTLRDDAEIVADLSDEVTSRIESGELPADARENLPVAVTLLKSRARFPVEILDYGFYFFRDPETIVDAKAAKKRLKDEETPARLEELARRFEALDEFTEETMEVTLRGYTEELDVGAGKLIHPTRLAVSGQGVGPGLFDLLAALGRDTVVRRMRWLAGFLRKHGTPPNLPEISKE